jgi:hypothetical protein
MMDIISPPTSGGKADEVDHTVVDVLRVGLVRVFGLCLA